jgi:hypothetical protein
LSDAEPHIVKARDSLTFARYALAGEYNEQAWRSAYMAAYHAAIAFIAARTGMAEDPQRPTQRIRAPRTRGTRHQPGTGIASGLEL